MELRERWPLPDRHEIRDELLAAWDAPNRGYHDLTHLTEVLDRLDELACDELPVLVAAWFHDAVYDGLPDAEERSALWAERTLPAQLAPEVARLVRLTAHHRPESGDDAGEALTDADLAILASGPERYTAYAAGVRHEYAHVEDDAFAAGRAAVLRDLLAKDHLFHTAYGRERWEETARANVERELASLSA